MTSRNKARGTRWETAVVRALSAFWRGREHLRPYRPAQAGRDVGDINGVDPFVIQAKDWKDWQSAIREGLDGAEKQKAHAGRSYGVAVVKRARKPVGQAYAVMTVETWARLMLRLRSAENLLESQAPEAYLRHGEAVAGFDEEEFPRA